MKLISISSGKGGVGKTTLTCNLATALADQGQRVLILDGDLGMSNVDIFFGVRAITTAFDLLQGKSIDQCITHAIQGIDILSGGSGLFEMTQINAFQRRELINQVNELQFRYDYVLIDTAPGLHEFVLHFNAVADDNIIVVTQDPASFTDAYALIKVLNKKHKLSEFKIICNQVDEKNGQNLFVKLSEVVEKFLSVRLTYLASVPLDPQLTRIQQMQRLILRQAPNSPSCETFRQLSKEIISETTSIVSEPQQSKGLESIFRPVTGHA